MNLNYIITTPVIAMCTFIGWTHTAAKKNRLSVRTKRIARQDSGSVETSDSGDESNECARALRRGADASRPQGEGARRPDLRP